MGFLTSLLGFIGFGIGFPIGLLLGFFIFIYFDPSDVKDPIVRSLDEFDSDSLIDIFPQLPMWVKHPDYDRIDWLNKFLTHMWPFLDKGICCLARSQVEHIFREYNGKFLARWIGFKCLNLGTLPPVIQGIKAHDSHEKELVIEPVIRWAGNPNITVALKFLFLQITIQLLDVQVFATPRITFKPLVPSFPCFSSIVVSLLEKPHVDFGMKLLGADVMAIPGLYQFVQDLIKRQIANLYLWPQALDIQILDSSVGASKKPVGILHIKVLRAFGLLKMDLLGTSDPYVQVSLTGERIPAKKTSIKMKNLNPEWNEEFKLSVKDPQSQVLELHVYDWEKLGKHDKLGVQVVPLKLLTPHETKEFTLDLVKNTNPNDPHNKRPRGKLVVEMTFSPFKEDVGRQSGHLNSLVREKSGALEMTSTEVPLSQGGLLLVTVEGAEDVEGKYHNNPFAVVTFRGEEKKTKVVRKSRNPMWNEEYQFVLEEAPLNEKIHIEVISKRAGISFRSKERLGYVDINLVDVVCNGRIKESYHLINSRSGVITVDIRWKVI